MTHNQRMVCINLCIAIACFLAGMPIGGWINLAIANIWLIQQRREDYERVSKAVSKTIERQRKSNHND